MSLGLSDRNSIFLIRSGAWRYCLRNVDYFSQSVVCPFCDFCLTTEHLLDFCPRFEKSRSAMRTVLGMGDGSLAILFESAPVPKMFVYTFVAIYSELCSCTSTPVFECLGVGEMMFYAT